MKKSLQFILAFSAVLFWGSKNVGQLPGNAKNEFVDAQQDARDGVTYLNQIRANPNAFSGEFGVDLGAMKANKNLIWNDTLAKVARAKAQDMARRNFFAHVDPDGNGMNIKIAQAGYALPADWYSDHSKNYFESLGAGYSNLHEAIKQLIIDAGTPGLGHRLHLLGQGDFWGNCYDIGIGEVQVSSGSTYTSYYSFIIAKHNF
jgi:uncharacterized protein YkwD